jgi:hypothetical protein
MEPAVWGLIGAIVGGLITGFVTLGVELIRANKAAALDSATRRDDRQLGRDQFQRETLLELQRVVTEYMTSLGRLTRLGTPDLIPDASRGALQVGTLGSRVDDDLVRMATEKVVEKGASILRGKAVDAAFDEATGIAMAVNSRAGELIRATFVDPPSRSEILSYPPKATQAEKPS